MDLIYSIVSSTLSFLSIEVAYGVSYLWLVIGILIFCIAVRFF